MSISAVRFDEYTMWVELTDGRTLGVPLAWFPRLLRATPAERKRVEISRIGLHWDGIDENISVAGLLAGRGDMTPHTGAAPLSPDEKVALFQKLRAMAPPLGDADVRAGIDYGRDDT